jgi:hypothetical protein
MDTRLKIATVASVASIVVAALAISLTPAGASHGSWWMNDEKFEAKNSATYSEVSTNSAVVTNETNQMAATGSVTVSHNDDDFDGSAATGGADNTAGTMTAGTLTNSPSAAPSAPAPSLGNVDWDDFDSVKLTNTASASVVATNSAVVTNATNQNAMSGSVSIHCNDDDITGDVTTGDASNTSSTTTMLTLSN